MKIKQKAIAVPGNMHVREVSTYKYDDLMAYVSATAFLSMLTIFLLILSL